MEYGSISFLVVKSLHIIFMVSYFAGIFYLLRLFVYYKEAELREHKAILQQQFSEMIKKLWNIITVPAFTIMLLTGFWMLSVNDFYLLHQNWMHVKIGFLVLLFVFHYFTWILCKKIVQKQSMKYTSLQLRKINEIPTLILFAVVFVVILKQNIFTVYPKLILGFIVLALVIMLIIKLVNRKK